MGSDKLIKVVIIHTRDNIILSKKQYETWRDIQHEYNEYVTSLGPFTQEELFDYFEIEYKNEWPIKRSEIESFFLSTNTQLAS